MPREKLTAIVTTLNEEGNIADCLATLSFADETLVVDSFSADRTLQIASAIPKVRVLQHEYAGNGPQCNWAMEQASHRWILIVDADERVTPPLAREIEQLLEKGPPAKHYQLRRDNLFAGKVIRHSGWGQDRLVRLLEKGSARYPEQRVHADMSPSGPTPVLDAPLLHYTVRSIPQYLEKLHRYAEWGAQDLAQKGRRAGFLEIVFRPAWRFFRSYILQAGFLDGLHGIVVCALQSYGVFLKWSRLWELQRLKDAPE